MRTPHKPRVPELLDRVCNTEMLTMYDCLMCVRVCMRARARICPLVAGVGSIVIDVCRGRPALISNSDIINAASTMHGLTAETTNTCHL